MQYLNMDLRYKPGMPKFGGLGDYEGLVDAELAKRVDQANLLLSQAKDMIESALTPGVMKSTRDDLLSSANYKLVTAINTLKLADLAIPGAMIPGSESVIESCGTLIEQVTQIQKQMIQEYTSVWGQIKLTIENNTTTLQSLANNLWAAAKAGSTQVVKSAVDLTEKAAKIATGFMDYLPLILGGLAAVIIIPMLGKFKRNPRRFRRNPGMSWLPLLAVGGGAAFLIASKKKETIIPTASATQISIGLVSNVEAAALKTALDAVQVPYTAQTRGDQVEFFVDARFSSAAKKALDDVKNATSWKENLISTALPKASTNWWEMPSQAPTISDQLFTSGSTIRTANA